MIVHGAPPAPDKKRCQHCGNLMADHPMRWKRPGRKDITCSGRAGHVASATTAPTEPAPSALPDEFPDAFSVLIPRERHR